MPLSQLRMGDSSYQVKLLFALGGTVVNTVVDIAVQTGFFVMLYRVPNSHQAKPPR